MRISQLSWGQARSRGFSKGRWDFAKKMSCIMKKWWAEKEKGFQVHIKINYKKEKSHANFNAESTFYIKAKNRKIAKDEALRRFESFLDLDVREVIPLDMKQEGKRVWVIKSNKAHEFKSDYARVRYKKGDKWVEYEDGKRI